MKKLLLLPAVLILACCQQAYWQMYKQEAMKEGYIPIPPKELFPDEPERGYLDDGVPYLAGSIINDEERTKYQQLLQQAAKVKLIQVRQAGNDCWSLETTKKELAPVPVNDSFRQLVQSWSTAPEWLHLTPCGVDFAGVFISMDVFVFLDEQGNESGSISIGLSSDIVCKPEGQRHYDRLREKMLSALGLPM
jgi:hypothetical protein